MKIIFHSVIALWGLRIGIASPRSLASPPGTPTAESLQESPCASRAIAAAQLLCSRALLETTKGEKG